MKPGPERIAVVAAAVAAVAAAAMVATVAAVAVAAVVMVAAAVVVAVVAMIARRAGNQRANSSWGVQQLLLHSNQVQLGLLKEGRVRATVDFRANRVCFSCQ